MKVHIIDYGSGNLLSVRRAFEFCGAAVEVTVDPEAVRTAERLVLPGVGAFGDCMDSLKAKGLDQAIREFVSRGRPFIGVCVGMQVLFEQGDEFGPHDGLGLVPGTVGPIPPVTTEGVPHKLPHIGWSSLFPPEGETDVCWRGTVMDGVQTEDAVYFAHSYMATVRDSERLLARTIYGGHSIPAVVRRDNVTGLQFHPEKSGQIGLRIVRNYLR